MDGTWMAQGWHMDGSWMLHQNAEDGFKQTLESACHKQLNGEFPELSDRIREGWMHFAGHCYRSENESVS